MSKTKQQNGKENSAMKTIKVSTAYHAVLITNSDSTPKNLGLRNDSSLSHWGGGGVNAFC